MTKMAIATYFSCFSYSSSIFAFALPDSEVGAGFLRFRKLAVAVFDPFLYNQPPPFMVRRIAAVFKSPMCLNAESLRSPGR